jgi:diguanylate cyclase (GGDEF)-like protein
MLSRRAVKSDGAAVPPRRSSRRILASGVAAAVAMAVTALVVLNPLTAARDDLHALARDGIPLQAQLIALRTTVVDWQFFIERHLDALTPGVASSPTDVVEGGRIAAKQAAQALAMSRGLRRVGFATDASKLDTAMTAFNSALETLSPVASGAPVEPAALRDFVDAERSAIEHLWNLTTQIGDHLSQGVTAKQSTEASDHVNLGFWLFATAAGIAVLIVLAAAAILARRAGGREREQRHVELQHSYESQVQEALEMTKTEPEVYEILGEALHRSVPQLKTEMLIADSSRAHFRRALTNGQDFEGCSVVSPNDCPAATVGHALVFPSSRALNACPYLKGRPSGECSAACLPVSIAGRTVGVTHAIGLDGIPPTAVEIETLNFTSRRGSERVAMIRAFATSQTQAQTDPLTGLLNRRSLENAVRDLRNDGVPYALAYGDLDHFKILNDTHGHEAGDQALRLFATVLGESLRPIDIAARYGGEEFVIVLPDCDTAEATSILERVRESLALTLSAGRVPAFTVTFGVPSSRYAEEFDAVVAIADHALLDAKMAGRNRVLVADISANPDLSEPAEIVDVSRF